MSSSIEINKEDLKNSIVNGPLSAEIFTEEEDFLDQSSERARELEEIKTKREYNRLLQQNREEKKKYASLIFKLTCFWASLIFIIVIANGLKSLNERRYFEFILSDKVIITLITSTTVNFFGFFLLVVKYLFNTKDISAISIPETKK